MVLCGYCIGKDRKSRKIGMCLVGMKVGGLTMVANPSTSLTEKFGGFSKNERIHKLMRLYRNDYIYAA